MKKVLIFSHASVLEVNRDIFYNLSHLHDVDLRIVCPEVWGGDLIRDLRCQENKKSPQVPIISLPIVFSGNGSLFFYRSLFKEQFSDWNPDLIFVDEEPWSIACLQIYYSFPRSELIFYTKQNLRKKIPFPFSRIQQLVFKKSPFCFSVTKEVAEVLQWKGFRGPINVLPHSFDPDRFRPISFARKVEIRSSLGLGIEPCLIGYFGRLDPEKGIEDFLFSLELLEARGIQNVEVLIVGNGRLEGQVKEFIRQRRKLKIVFRNAIPHDHVGETLAALDVLVLPSRTMRNWKEQFGRILVEAMACGVAVIGSDSGEIPNLIQQSGAGMVFPEKNANSLSLCVEILASNAAVLEGHQKKGYSFAVSTLTHERVALNLGAMLGFNPRSI